MPPMKLARWMVWAILGSLASVAGAQPADPPPATTETAETAAETPPDEAPAAEATTVEAPAAEATTVEAPVAEATTVEATSTGAPPVAAPPTEGVGWAVREPPGYWDDWRPIAGWSLVGGSLVFAALTGVFAMEVETIGDDERLVTYRAGTPAGTDACKRASSDPDASYIVDLCDSADAYGAATWAMVGLMAASFVTGSILVIQHGVDYAAAGDPSEASASDTGWLVAPFGLLGGGGLSLSGRF